MHLKMAEALRTVHTGGPKLVFWTDSSTSPGNYGWFLVFQVRTMNLKPSLKDYIVAINSKETGRWFYIFRSSYF
jgi:hypothetical protein